MEDKPKLETIPVWDAASETWVIKRIGDESAYDTPVGMTISKGILPRYDNVPFRQEPVVNSKGIGKTEQDKSTVVIRWILFIPAGVVAAIVAQWAVTIANNFFLSSMCIQSTDQTPSATYLAFMIIVGNLMYGAMFIYAACYVAPSINKMRIGVILMVPFCLLYTAVLFFNISQSEYWSTLGSVCNIIGSIGMVAAIQQDMVKWK